jgi:lactoylglutathione lyase
MKTFLFFFCSLMGFGGSISAQINHLAYLKGTWKVDHKELYEHWDSISPSHLKGFGYILREGQQIVTEYLDIKQEGKNIIYTATALGQNNGNAISFSSTNVQEISVTFSNPKHDNPKQITYSKLSDTSIQITLVLKHSKNKIYTMTKTHHPAQDNHHDELSPLGAFSLSLTVKDIYASKAFYEKLGFTHKGGDINQKWIVLKNGNVVIGLFEGMFPKNMITFNPGWDQKAAPIEKFKDIRLLYNELKEKDIKITMPIGNKVSGPESFILEDPDGNPILFDQHR